MTTVTRRRDEPTIKADARNFPDLDVLMRAWSENGMR
jgi:hypothetical protein